MKRIHIHLHVTDLDQARGFYSRLLGTEPTKTRDDYLQWRLEDPAINLALTRSSDAGVGHLGLDLEDLVSLGEIRDRVGGTAAQREQAGVACCYKRSDKVWYADPDGVSWETFHSFGDEEQLAERGGTCCEPKEAATACCA
jgi:catechol 2,3-dioxygenase-like lactoylglutathione lyase family enzyme